MTKAEAKLVLQKFAEYHAKAIEAAWMRKESVTLMYLELANVEAKKLADYFNSE